MAEFNDLRLLTVFVAVYRQKGISAAARVLNVSQPSVTRSIQRLEHELGAPLFHRSTTGIYPTEFGARLYGRALSVIDEVDSIHADARHLGTSTRVLVKVGCGIGCWASLCDATVSFQAEHPNTAFNITVASARGLVAQAEAGGADVIVANRTILESAAGVTVESWKTSTWHYVARAGHPVFLLPEADQGSTIIEYPFATYHLLENAHGTSMSGSPALRANDHLMLLRYVKSCNCYTTISSEMLEYADKHGLRVVGVDGAHQTEFAVAYPSNGVLSPEADLFLEHLRGRERPS